MEGDKSRIKVCYVGLQYSPIFALLKEERIEIVSVAQIDYLLEKTFNPINLILKKIYRKTINSSKIRKINGILSYLVKTLSTGAYKRYADLVLLLATRGIKTININDLPENQVDIFVVNVWDILPSEVLCRAKMGALNIHPSKLPTYRGALPTLWSLKNHDKSSAISYIILNNKMDTGGILKQYTFDIENSDNYLNIEKKIEETTSQTICEVILNYFDGLIVPTKQDSFGAISYTGKYEVYKKIKWSEETSSEIFNKIGLYPYLEYGVFCYTNLDEKVIEIKKIKVEGTQRNKLPPGHFTLKGLRVYVGSKDDTMSFSVFNYLPLFLKRKGIFSN